jgi:hypothetical protein
MIAIPAMCLAMNVAAECTVKKPRDLPLIPDATVATEQEMYQAQLDVQEYLRQGERYLECSYMNSRQHNMLVTQMEIVARQYNLELSEYQSQQNLVAEAD